MIGVLILIAGAVLKFVSPPLFQQAHQVGLILIIAGGFVVVLRLLLLGLGLRSYKKFEKKHFGDWPRW